MRGSMSQPAHILLALARGPTLGIVAAATRGDWLANSILVAEPIGRVGLNALQCDSGTSRPGRG